MGNELKNKLLAKQGGQCKVCGASNVPLEIHELSPIFAGGTADESSSVLLCANCNRASANTRFTEVEFNNYLAHLLMNSAEFTGIKQEERISRENPYRADITAHTKDGKSLLIECKNASSFTPARLHQAIHQIKAYQAATSFNKYVLAFPGLISSAQAVALKSHGIEAWDAHTLATKFKAEVAASPHPVFQMLLSLVSPTNSNAPEEAFIQKLKACKKGKESWSEYQKLVGQILEHLFCPPLETPISELPDHDGINRRDWILPNYADSGFWNFIREKYHADYVVVDAKNYRAQVSKNQVLQMANYLKIHGAGMFAIIVTRIGADKSALLTLREQWMANKKMILIVNDEDIEAMLLAKLAGGNPEKVIGQAIENFRLSM